MKIAKYNTKKGSNTYKTTINNYIGGSSVDTSGMEAQIAANTISINQNKVNITNLQNVVNDIPNKYLKRTGDSSEHSYKFGTIYTDNLESQNYNSGRGYRLVGSADSTTNDKYFFKIIDLGNGYIHFTYTNSSEAEVVGYTNYDKISLEKHNAFTITNSVSGASVIVQAGYNLTQSQKFTIISEKLQYKYFQSISTLTAAAPSNNFDDSMWADAREVHNGWEIPITSDGRQTTYELRYVVEYSYNDSTINGTISLFISGTDPNNDQTLFYGGSSRYTEMTSTYVQCISGSSGCKITSDGIYKSSDGGENWTKVI